MEQIKTNCIDNGEKCSSGFFLTWLLWKLPPCEQQSPVTLQHFQPVNHVHVSSRLGPTSCWPELMQLAVDQLPLADSSLSLFLLDRIVPQQLFCVDQKCVLGLNYQLPNLS